MNPAIVFLFVAVVLVIAASCLIVRQNRASSAAFTKTAKKLWGSSGIREVSDTDLKRHAAYAKSRAAKDDADRFRLDAITWNDLELTKLYGRISRCVSDMGDEVLYDWLQGPVTDPALLDARKAAIRYLTDREDVRNPALLHLRSCGRGKALSCTDAIGKLMQAPHVGRAPYLLAGGLTVISVVLLFVMPVPAVFLLIASLAANLIVSGRAQAKMSGYLDALSRVLAMIRCAREMKTLSFPEETRLNERLESACEILGGITRGSGMLTSSVGTGADSVLLTYLKLFFHIDLIRFDRIVSSLRGHEDDLDALLETLGSVDSAISCASFLASLPWSCEAVFAASPFGQDDLDTKMDAGVEIEEMYHPLLSQPVANSIRMRGGILITGSNASGKSTFLRNVAVCALLAQSIGFVPAKAYRAPAFAIYTSMALRDDLLGHESYFMAELRAVKRILDAADQMRTPLLVLIDEVLRGTNTVERIAASSQILWSLRRSGVLIFAATHDGELTEILDGIYENWHFSELLGDEDVSFSYKILPGRAETRNAIALLKRTGFPAEMAEEAEAEAERFEKEGVWRL